MKYAIKHPILGYLCNDDSLYGYAHDWCIDEFTITFDSEEDAKHACDLGETIVEIEGKRK